MRITLTVGMFALLLCAIASASGYPKPRVPEPLPLPVELAAAWDYIDAVLEKLDCEAVTIDRAAGLLITGEQAAFSGTRTRDELRKVAVLASDLTTFFRQGAYRLEISVRFLNPGQTEVSVSAHIRALRRELDGTEAWIDLKSNGAMEMRFLNELHILVTGKRLYDKKMPYWKRGSQEIDW